MQSFSKELKNITPLISSSVIIHNIADMENFFKYTVFLGEFTNGGRSNHKHIHSYIVDVYEKYKNIIFSFYFLFPQYIRMIGINFHENL